jgi:DNA invertase Pin-like site-specific DNA recombinase
MHKQRTASRYQTPYDRLAGRSFALYCRVSLDDTSRERSVRDQEVEGREWVPRVGGTLAEAHILRDNSRPASRFTRKARPAYGKLLDLIASGELGAVWVWAQNRASRQVKVTAELVDLCREHDVLFVAGGRVFDMKNPDDVAQIQMQAVWDEKYTADLSRILKERKELRAAEGRPAGRVPFGYRRIWEPTASHEWVRDEPDDESRTGRPEDAPAAVVREIFDRIAAGDSINRIRRDLNDRGVRTRGDKRRPEGYPFDNFNIRHIATNPAYIAKRVYQAPASSKNVAEERLAAVWEGVEAQWPALVDEDVWWTVHRILTDPRRTTFRPTPRGDYLLSALARCDVCGGKLAVKKAPGRPDGYACRDNQCVGVPASDLDDYVEDQIVKWLMVPATAELVTRTQEASSSAEVKQARADADQARAELQRLLARVEAGEVDEDIGTAKARNLHRAISDAEQRIADTTSTLPAVLVATVGPWAEAGWDALDRDAKREIIGAVADVRVRQVGRAWRVPVADRVEGRWLLGGGDPWAKPDEWDLTGDPLADRIGRALLDAGSEGLTRTQLRDSLKIGASSARLDAALTLLESRGLAVRSFRPSHKGEGRAAVGVWRAPDAEPGPGDVATRVQPCGTYAAAQRHKYHGEPIDPACREALNAYKRMDAKRRRARRAAG